MFSNLFRWLSRLLRSGGEPRAEKNDVRVRRDLAPRGDEGEDGGEAESRRALESLARGYYHDPYGWVGGILTEMDEIRAVGRASRRMSQEEEEETGKE